MELVEYITYTYTQQGAFHPILELIGYIIHTPPNISSNAKQAGSPAPLVLFEIYKYILDADLPYTFRPINKGYYTNYIVKGRPSKYEEDEEDNTFRVEHNRPLYGFLSILDQGDTEHGVYYGTQRGLYIIQHLKEPIDEESGCRVDPTFFLPLSMDDIYHLLGILAEGRVRLTFDTGQLPCDGARTKVFDRVILQKRDKYLVYTQEFGGHPLNGVFQLLDPANKIDRTTEDLYTYITGRNLDMDLIYPYDAQAHPRSIRDDISSMDIDPRYVQLNICKGVLSIPNEDYDTIDLGQEDEANVIHLSTLEIKDLLHSLGQHKVPICFLNDPQADTRLITDKVISLDNGVYVVATYWHIDDPDNYIATGTS